MSRTLQISRSALAALLLAVSASSLAAQSGADVARAYREAHEPAIVRDFAELLSYPNRASDTEDIRRAAEYIRGELEEAGVAAELLQV
ncbi:MAG: hypothetical protein OEZ65_16860, partial [Gemmatimonadota bacterium]|nr:hypothetical protein [Gemmatimonadota bacterium]